MKKENLINLVNYLNSRQKAFLLLSNNIENIAYHLSEISFSIVSEELHNGDIPITDYCMKITIKKKDKKRRKNKLIILDNLSSIKELYEWELPKIIRAEIFQKIADFSGSTIFYSYKSDNLISCKAAGVISTGNDIMTFSPFDDDIKNK